MVFTTICNAVDHAISRFDLMVLTNDLIDLIQFSLSVLQGGIHWSFKFNANLAFIGCGYKFSSNKFG